MFRLSEIDECSYCLEQSYLLGLVDMVTPQYSWMDRERMCVCVCVYTHADLCLGWKDMCVVNLLGFLPTGPGSSFKVIPSVFMEEVETIFHYFNGKVGSHNLVVTLT